jgi:hypothetical protein
VEINTMREKMDNLFDTDTRSRWRIILTSSLAVALFGFIAQLSGSSLLNAQIGACIVGGVFFFTQLFLYATPAKKPVNDLRPRREAFRSALAVMASGLLAILASASAPIVDAAVLDRRLKDALEQKRSEPSVRAVAASNIVSYAMRSGLKLRSNLVTSATNEFWHENTPEAWLAYVALLNYTVNLRANKGDFDVAIAGMQQLYSVGNLPACRPDNEVAMIGQVMAKNNNFQEPESLKSWPNGLHNCKLLLDGKALKDYFLFDLMIEYHGGELTLENVRFSICRLVLEDNPNARTFAEALLHSDNNIVTISIK